VPAGASSTLAPYQAGPGQIGPDRPSDAGPPGPARVALHPLRWNHAPPPVRGRQPHPPAVRIEPWRPTRPCGPGLLTGPRARTLIIRRVTRGGGCRPHPAGGPGRAKAGPSPAGGTRAQRPAGFRVEYRAFNSVTNHRRRRPGPAGWLAAGGGRSTNCRRRREEPARGAARRGGGRESSGGGRVERERETSCWSLVVGAGGGGEEDVAELVVEDQDQGAVSQGKPVNRRSWPSVILSITLGNQ
jgi:hypothetical protein